MASTTHQAELEVESTDLVGVWKALEAVVVDSAAVLGTPATTGDYHVANSDGRGTVAGADLGDCLDRVGNPASISVTYTSRSSSDPDPHSIELRIMRHRRHKELDVHLRVTGPMDVQTLNLFERTKTKLGRAIEDLNEP